LIQVTYEDLTGEERVEKCRTFLVPINNDKIILFARRVNNIILLYLTTSGNSTHSEDFNFFDEMPDGLVSNFSMW